jgi:hypothetical protein
MKLTGMTDDTVVNAQNRAAARVPGCVLVWEHLDPHATRLGDQSRGIDRIAPRHRASGTPPSGTFSITRQGNGDPAGLTRQHRVNLLELLLSRRPSHHRSRRLMSITVGPIHPADLVNGEIVGAASDVTAKCLEQPGEQRGAQLGFFVRQRIGKPQCSATRVVERQT